MSLAQWSDYWAVGNLTSLPSDFKHNYEGEIKDFWFSHFNNLPAKAKILDVCTGNGAVAYLAQDYAREHEYDWLIIAVDGAEIRQDKVREQHSDVLETSNSIQFVSRVLIEDLCLDIQDFDLITSQYGIEYCDWQKSAHQINSHLSDGGRFVCLTHAPETDISDQMRKEKDVYRWIERLGLFEAMEKLLSGRMNLKQLQKLNNKQNLKLGQKWQQTQNPLIKGFYDYSTFMQSVQDQHMKQVIPEVKSLLTQHQQAYQRLLDIVGVADRIKSNPQWFTAFETDNMTLVSRTEVHYQGKHLAGIGYEFSTGDNK